MRQTWWVVLVLVGCGQQAPRPDAPGWWVPTGDEVQCGEQPSCVAGVPGCLESDGSTSDDVECWRDPLTGVVRPVCRRDGRPVCLRPFE